MKCCDCAEEVYTFEEQASCEWCRGIMHADCYMVHNHKTLCEDCCVKAEKRDLEWSELDLPRKSKVSLDN